MKTRREFLKISATVTATAPAFSAGGFSFSLTSKRPNLLFVFTDQQSFDMLGCYGNAQIQTPNIDRLAAEGVRFDYCISSSPVCTPMRAMLLSGQHVLKNGAFTNDINMLQGNGLYFGEVLKANGYRTGYVGKWHVYGGDRNRSIPAGPYRYGFDDVFLSNNCSLKFFDGFYFDQMTGQKVLWPAGDWEVDHQAEQAVNYIDQAPANQPWALFVSWHPPHDHDSGTYNAPEELKALYNPNDIILRPTMADTPEIRADMQGYMAMCTSCDIAFGRLIDKLKEKGLEDNTIIVFTADHGDLHGAHGRPWAKGCPEDEACRVPLLIRYPKKLRSRTSELLVGTLDLMPTILGLMDIQAPSTCDGQNLTPHLMAENDAAVESVPLMFYNPSWRGVVTRNFTYSENAAGSASTVNLNCLYDRQNDPHQTVNRFGDPAYAAQQQQMKTLMQQWLDRYEDPFLPENTFINLMGFPTPIDVGTTGMLTAPPAETLRKFITSSRLTHRYTFENSVEDSAGVIHGTATVASTYLEAPSYVSSVPAGIINGGPSRSIQIGTNAEKQKSGFTLSNDVIAKPEGSYSFWLNADKLDSNDYILAVLAIASGPLIRGASANSVALSVGGKTTAATVAAGRWTHIAVTWNDINGSTVLYVDGIASGTVSFPPGTIIPTGVRIGGFNLADTADNLANQFKGKLYDLQFYAAALTTAQIATIFNHPGSTA